MPTISSSGIRADDATVTIDDLRAGRVEPADLGYGVEFRQVISIIGDRLTLLYVETTGGERRFSVEEIDEHGRLARIHHFPAANLVNAVNEVDARWQAIENPPAVVVAMHAWSRASREFDQAAVSELTDESFSLVDHRPVVDRSSATRWLDQTGIEVCGARRLGRSESALRPRRVVRSMMLTVNIAGDLREGLVTTTVFAHRDGLATLIEVFDEDDLAGALARAAEIDPDGFADHVAKPVELLEEEPGITPTH